jgi:hypothetical protein
MIEWMNEGLFAILVGGLRWQLQNAVSYIPQNINLNKYYINITNIIHLNFHNNLIVLNSRHVFDRRPSSEGTSLACLVYVAASEVPTEDGRLTPETCWWFNPLTLELDI